MGLAETLRRRVLKAAEGVGMVRTLPYWPGLGFPPPAPDHGLPASSFIVAPARRLIVFRLLGYRAEPHIRDFQSNQAKDRPQGPDETYADYLGISVFSTEHLAVENAVRWPKHVAAVLLPDAEGYSIARTYPEIEGHYTVWGDPERLLASVQRVSTHSEPGTFQDS